MGNRAKVAESLSWEEFGKSLDEIKEKISKPVRIKRGYINIITNITLIVSPNCIYIYILAGSLENSHLTRSRLRVL